MVEDTEDLAVGMRNTKFIAMTNFFFFNIPKHNFFVDHVSEYECERVVVALRKIIGITAASRNLGTYPIRVFFFSCLFCLDFLTVNDVECFDSELLCNQIFIATNTNGV